MDVDRWPTFQPSAGSGEAGAGIVAVEIQTGANGGALTDKQNN